MTYSDIPREVATRLDAFPDHGHWHDMADCIYDMGTDAEVVAWATAYAREVRGVDVDADPIRAD